MKVFISHATGDKKLLENTLTPLLKARGVVYWTDETLENGLSLNQGLLEAIAQSAACILLATEASLASEWCLMEVAAFFAAGKRVFIFSPTGDLKRDTLPPYLRDLVFQGTTEQIVTQADEEVAAYEPEPRRLVRDMPIAELRELVRTTAGLVRQEQVERNLNGVSLLVRGVMAMADAFLPGVVQQDGSRPRLSGAHPGVSIVVERLRNLIGIPIATFRDSVEAFLPFEFIYETDGDRWHGFGVDDSVLQQESSALLVRAGEDSDIDGIGISARLANGLFDIDYVVAGGFHVDVPYVIRRLDV